jgi:predicted DNA-binding transcriptional regulator AlpA
MADLTADLQTALVATTNHFETLIRQCVRSELSDFHAHGDPEALLDASQAAALLGMSPAALRRAAERGRFPVPPVRIGRRLRWRRADLHQLLVNRQGAKASTNRQKKASSRASTSAQGTEGGPSHPDRLKSANLVPSGGRDCGVT